MRGSAAFRRPFGIVCAALISLLAGLIPASAAGPAWAIVPSPSAMRANGDMLAVSCSSSTDCTAAGAYMNKTGKRVPLAAGWNGTSWSIQPAPNPTGAIFSFLNGVSCPSATACEAVGQTGKTLGKSATLAEMWNGTAWTIQATPNPAGGLYNSLEAISCPSPTSCMAVGTANDPVGGTSTTLAESWNGTIWSIVPTPNVAGSSDNNLGGVSCASATACIAVGSSTPSGGGGNTVTLAEAWNGTTWTILSTPNPAGSLFTQLAAVSCSSSTMCTAVGSFDSNTSGLLTLAERWNGTTWSIQTTVNPSGSISSSLAGVACPASNYCTAVGTRGNSTGSVTSPLAERWNGTSWAVQSIPRPAGSTNSALVGVACASPVGCIAVGQFSPNAAAFPGSSNTLAEGWNGTAWSIQPSSNPVGASISTLQGVSCTSSSACIAVGQAETKAHGIQTLVETWDGSLWTVQPTPLPTGALFSSLSAVSCTSTTACTAVGLTSNTRVSGLAEQWNGTSWTIQPTPTPTGSGYDQLAGVSCASSTSCEAVGTAGISGSSSPFAEAWNGTTWSLQTIPLPGGASGAGLSGVSCTSSSACTAVGSYFDSTGTTTLTLVEMWNGAAWAVQSSPNPAGSTNSSLNAVSCPSPTVCTAVGYDSEAGGTTTIAEGWNGSAWTLETTPNPSGAANSFLNGVSCTSSTACEAVGNSNGGTGLVPLAEVWNGSAWSIQATPSPKGAFAELIGVACISTTPCYAVGLYTFTKFAQLTLIESYS